MSYQVNNRMARDIESYEAIDRLQQLSGASIEEIERRARPGANASSGFLGADESLKEVLKKDWQTVSHLGTTHIALAGHLRTLWNKCGQYGSTTILYPSTSIEPFLKRTPFQLALLISLVTAAAVLLFSNPLIWLGLILAIPPMALAISNQQILSLSHVQHKGFQEGIFNVAPNDSSPGRWSSQLTIKNLLNSKEVLVGEGVIDYIEKYGFYEGGGDENPYRIDPARLAAII